jgi:hypothetical protein
MTTTTGEAVPFSSPSRPRVGAAPSKSAGAFREGILLPFTGRLDGGVHVRAGPTRLLHQRLQLGAELGIGIGLPVQHVGQPPQRGGVVGRLLWSGQGRDPFLLATAQVFAQPL